MAWRCCFRGDLSSACLDGFAQLRWCIRPQKAAEFVVHLRGVVGEDRFGSGRTISAESGLGIARRLDLLLHRVVAMAMRAVVSSGRRAKLARLPCQRSSLLLSVPSHWGRFREERRRRIHRRRWEGRTQRSPEYLPSVRRHGSPSRDGLFGNAAGAFRSLSASDCLDTEERSSDSMSAPSIAADSATGPGCPLFPFTRERYDGGDLAPVDTILAWQFPGAE